MADNAFEWAGARGLLRVNPMHQEQEAKLVVGETFQMREEQGTARTQQVRMDVEASCQQVFVHMTHKYRSSYFKCMCVPGVYSAV